MDFFPKNIHKKCTGNLDFRYKIPLKLKRTKKTCAEKRKFLFRPIIHPPEV